jgi:hypothetical protein
MDEASFLVDHASFPVGTATFSFLPDPFVEARTPFPAPSGSFMEEKAAERRDLASLT